MRTKNIYKKLLAIIVTVMLLLSTLSVAFFTANAATAITESTFQTKYNAFKKNVYPDGSTYKNDPTKTGGYECFGYANEIAKYIYGSYPTSSGSAVSSINTNWSISRGANAINNLHIGDIVRYKASSAYDHSIFVYKISSDKVYYTDANGGSVYNYVASRSVTKTALKEKIASKLVGNTSVVGYVAHYKGWKDTNTLTMKYNVNGGTISNPVSGYRYTVVPSVGVNLRKAAGTGSTVIKTLSQGTTFDVYLSDATKTANGYTWGKTTVGGDTGWIVISDSTLAKKGNAIRNPDYYSSSSLVYKASTAAVYTQKWNYGSGNANGLANATSFGLKRSGYSFVGWALNANGSGTIFDQDDTSLKAETICPDVKTADKTVTLYAVWRQNAKTVSEVTIETLPETTTYYVGDTIDLTGLKLKVTYSDGTTLITEECITSEFDSSTPGVKTLLVGYQDSFTSFDLTVAEPTISISESVHLASGSRQQLVATANPSSEEVSWISQDEEVATVENGTVTAVAAGTTAICAEIDYNDIPYIAVCTVVVDDGIKKGVDDVNFPVLKSENTSVNTGETFVTTMTLENSKDVCNGTFVLEYDSDMLSVKSYAFGDAVEISDKMCNLDYLSEGNLIFVSFTGADEVADGTLITFTWEAKQTTGSAFVNFRSVALYDVMGKAITTLTDDGTIDISEAIAEKVLTDISVSTLPTKTIYEIGELLDTTGLTLKLTYSDNSTEIVSSGFTTICFDAESDGSKTVIVAYEEKTTTFTVEVKPAVTDENAPQIVFENKKARAGNTVDVNISLKNNPGIASMKIKVAFDSDLALTGIVYNDAIGGSSQQPQNLNSPVVLNWYNGAANSNGDFVFATLTFEVSDYAQVGNKRITATYDPDDLYNIDEDNIEFAVVAGNIEVISYIPGDINDDGKTNNKDLTRLFQYLSEWDVEVNVNALDVNGDGKVNNKDITRLFQYLSEWDVEIF